jgi:hypothetical protein
MTVRVVAGASGQGRFELERVEPLKEGERLTQFTMMYKVLRILPADDEFDAVLEVGARRRAWPVRRLAA